MYADDRVLPTNFIIDGKTTTAVVFQLELLESVKLLTGKIEWRWRPEV